MPVLHLHIEKEHDNVVNLYGKIFDKDIKNTLEYRKWVLQGVFYINIRAVFISQPLP